MGYTTDFIGHVDIEPALNDAEIGYLTAFSLSRRWARPGGPYELPADPCEERPEVLRDNSFNVPPDEQPGLWCDWVPCWDGCCLAYNGVERFYGSVRWLAYLIDHFLRPGAAASRAGLSAFAEFTFDHALDGMVVGCRRDNKELFAIAVTGNRVAEVVLRPGDRRLRDLPPLPYEQVIDRELAPQQRLRRERTGQVLPFTRPGA